MALIKCNECGKEISDKAKVCINCGCPIIKNFDKEYKKLSKEEKILAGKEISKDNSYKSFFKYLIAFSLVGMVISLITMNYFIMWLFIFLDVILAICLNIYIKNFYKKNLYCTNDKHSKNLSIEKDKRNTIKVERTKTGQQNYKWLSILSISCFILYFIFPKSYLNGTIIDFGYLVEKIFLGIGIISLSITIYIFIKKEK